MNKVYDILLLLALLAVAGCGNKDSEDLKSDPQSEAMLDGVWVNADDESVAFKAVGDTLYYADEGALPVHFRVYGDSIYLDGTSPMQFHIEKLTNNVFQFKNQGGEIIRLVKTNDLSLADEMSGQTPEYGEVDDYNKEQEHDTLVVAGNEYKCTTHISPTKNKVVKTDYNNEGVGVGKVFYDNRIGLTVQKGGTTLFSKHFVKAEFAKYVPSEIMQHSILTDIVYDHSDNGNLVFQAIVSIPGNAAGYVIFITITPNGKYSFSQP